MTLHDILNNYLTLSFSEQDKDAHFERLMKTWLLIVPRHQIVSWKIDYDWF